jgi:NAD(P)-dependent dehydrogenase (short-subunit alcohol dehydrogenase family)
MIDCDFKNKVAVVTGAGGGGVGPAACRLFARQGASVVAACIHLSEAEQVAKECQSIGAKAIATHTDVTKLGDCNEMVRLALEAFGRVDILVTVPAWTSTKFFIQETEEEWHKAMNVTFWGAVHAVKAVLSPMTKQRSGSIVLISSDTVKTHQPGSTMYGSAKAGLNSFATHLAKEVGSQGVRINVVSMGVTKTPKLMNSGWLKGAMEKAAIERTPLGRLAESEDVADTIAFLASEQVRFITGQLISVNGGAC